MVRVDGVHHPIRPVARQDDERTRRVGGEVQAHGGGEAVEERHDAQHALVAGNRGQPCLALGDVGGDRAVGEQYALGATGSAAGELEDGEAVWIRFGRERNDRKAVEHGTGGFGERDQARRRAGRQRRARVVCHIGLADQRSGAGVGEHGGKLGRGVVGVERGGDAAGGLDGERPNAGSDAVSEQGSNRTAAHIAEQRGQSGD